MKRTPLAAGLGLALLATLPATAQAGQAAQAAAAAAGAATPISHVVVIFQENVSFDHYFGTYPVAANTDGQHFSAASGTPNVDGLVPTGAGVPAALAHTADLTASNPNGAVPKRLSGGTVNSLLLCDQDHGYAAEQTAFDGGKMDKFPTGTGTSTGYNWGTKPSTNPPNQACAGTDALNYYDGNAVTALWNYAQHYAMSDNSFGTEFGPSAPGALDLVSGDLGNVSARIRSGVDEDVTSDGHGGYSLIDDAQPFYDDCSSRDAVAMAGKNIGDLMNAAGLSWGFFEGGFAPTTPYSGPPTPAGTYNPLSVTGRAVCGATHNIGPAISQAVAGSPAVSGGRTDQGAPKGLYGTKADYIPHHEPFQFYASTANPHHLAPASPSVIGTDTQTYTDGRPNFDTANHNYDINDFNNLVSQITAGKLSASHLPALSILKAPGYQDGHAGYSDPLDEQQFVTDEVNAIEASPDWSSTAIFISYDDSDGFYDHVDAAAENGGQPQNPSTSAADTYSGKGTCGTGSPLAGEEGRCGFGPRLPLLLISPWSKANYVDNNLSDQTSIINFVEYNWKLPSIPGSFDTILKSHDAQEGAAFDLAGMFNFSSKHGATLKLSPTTGGVVSQSSPSSSSSSGTTIAIVIAVIGLVIVVGIGIVITRRRGAARLEA